MKANDFTQSEAFKQLVERTKAALHPTPKFGTNEGYEGLVDTAWHNLCCAHYKLIEEANPQETEERLLLMTEVAIYDAALSKNGGG